jgi:hypothetical protein
MSLDAVTNYYNKDQPKDELLVNVFLALRGRAKGGHNEDACHLIPIAAKTASGLKPRL